MRVWLRPKPNFIAADRVPGRNAPHRDATAGSARSAHRADGYPRRADGLSPESGGRVHSTWPQAYLPPDRPADLRAPATAPRPGRRSEEHTSELQSLMRISYAVFYLNNNNAIS